MENDRRRKKALAEQEAKQKAHKQQRQNEWLIRAEEQKIVCSLIFYYVS